MSILAIRAANLAFDTQFQSPDSVSILSSAARNSADAFDVYMKAMKEWAEYSKKRAFDG
jgi:hypothetical protein